MAQQKTNPSAAKDNSSRAPESGEPTDRDARRGTPVGGMKDDVRVAPESGDRTKDSTGKR
jgi:hypothetical protein